MTRIELKLMVENNKLSFIDMDESLLTDISDENLQLLKNKHPLALNFLKEFGETGISKKIDVNMNGRHLANFSVLVGAGRIGKITGFEEAAALPEVFKALQLLHEGDEVTRPGTLQQVLGRFQIEADSREQLEEVIRTIDRTVRVEDAAGKTMRLVQTMHIL